MLKKSRLFLSVAVLIILASSFASVRPSQAAALLEVVAAQCNGVTVAGTSTLSSVEIELDSVDNGPWVIGTATLPVVKGRFAATVPFFNPPFANGAHVLARLIQRQGTSIIELAKSQATVSCAPKPAAGKFQLVLAGCTGVTVAGTATIPSVEVELDSVDNGPWVIGTATVPVSQGRFSTTVPFFNPPFANGTDVLARLIQRQGTTIIELAKVQATVSCAPKPAAGKFQLVLAGCTGVTVAGTATIPSVEVELDSVDNGPWVIGTATVPVSQGRFSTTVPFFNPPFANGTHVLARLLQHQGTSFIELAKLQATVSCQTAR